MGQGISLKSERNNPWFKPWFNINCVCLVISCQVIYILTAECWPLSYLFQREHSILEFIIKTTIRMCYFPSSSAAPSTVESEIILCALLSIPLLLSLDLQLATHSNRAATYFGGYFFVRQYHIRLLKCLIFTLELSCCKKQQKKSQPRNWFGE